VQAKKSCGYAVADLQNWAFTLAKISRRFEFKFLGILFIIVEMKAQVQFLDRKFYFFGCSGSEVSHFRN
jgi:hypothetical protein